MAQARQRGVVLEQDLHLPGGAAPAQRLAGAELRQHWQQHLQPRSALPVPPITAARPGGQGRPSDALPPGDWTELDRSDDFPMLDSFISPFV